MSKNLEKCIRYKDGDVRDIIIITLHDYKYLKSALKNDTLNVLLTSISNLQQF